MSLSLIAHAETIVLAVPGPGSVAFLPIHLAKAINADQAAGLELKLRYFNGGPLAMRDLMSNNSDFVAAALPVIAASRAGGMPVFAIGQLGQSAMFELLLRADLKGQVRTIAQLKGRRIGTSTSTSERSMGRMMADYFLQRAGLNSGDVQFISTGHNRESQGAALTSATADAIIADEPFASELVEQGVAIRLAELYSPKQSADLFGGSIVGAAFATREDIYTQRPATVKKVQHMFDLTLQWLSTHSAQEVADKLVGQPGFDAIHGKFLVDILKRNPGIFPNHITWDSSAVATTERFFHEVAASTEESKLLFSDFVRGAPLN